LDRQRARLQSDGAQSCDAYGGDDAVEEIARAIPGDSVKRESVAAEVG
jgi:hypothetical protein